MPGQAIVAINDKEWAVDIAVTPLELSQGRGGLTEIPPGTGMLFDMGWEQPIEVTTMPMLFPLDIAFLSSDLVVTEIYRNVEPGLIITSQLPARYFLEVNAGEMERIEAGDNVLFQSVEEMPAAPNWITGLVGFIGFVAMGFFMVRLSRELVKEALEEPEGKPVLLPQTSPGQLNDGVKRKPSGTCYADAWRFVIKEGEGELIHGTVFSGNCRIGHAWVETSTGWTWEPESGRYFTHLGFRDSFAPIIESRYTAEEAAIMAARTRKLGPWSEKERRRYLQKNSPAVIPKHKWQPRLKGELDFLPDSPEFLAYTIDDIGYREKIDSAFLSAIARARGGY